MEAETGERGCRYIHSTRRTIYNNRIAGVRSPSGRRKSANAAPRRAHLGRHCVHFEWSRVAAVRGDPITAASQVRPRHHPTIDRKMQSSGRGRAEPTAAVGTSAAAEAREKAARKEARSKLRKEARKKAAAAAPEAETEANAEAEAGAEAEGISNSVEAASREKAARKAARKVRKEARRACAKDEPPPKRARRARTPTGGALSPPLPLPGRVWRILLATSSS